MSNFIKFVSSADDGLASKNSSTYSISDDLREALTSEIIADASNEQDVLQKRIDDRTVRSKEDNYRSDRYNRDIQGLKKRNLEGDEAKEDEQPVKKRKSRWDVQSYSIPEESNGDDKSIKEDLLPEIQNIQGLRYFKESDKLYFLQKLDEKAVNSLTKEEKKERSLLLLLLKIKNGNTALRKHSMRHLTDKCSEYGPKLIFDSVLPILLDKTLEDQERHLMVKVVDRVLYSLGEQVRPYTQNILLVVSPLLLDEDPVARNTGIQIITNLASATGLATMLTVIRQNLENEDDYIRNVTARTIAIVSKALSVPKLLPFINAAAHSGKSWRARHTGIRSVQQIGILLGVGILPNLTGLIQCIRDGLVDQHVPVKILTANTLAVLAQASTPYGIEAFNIVLEPLWKGIHRHRGKVLSAFLKSLASIIPLMDPEYASYYSQEIMRIIKPQFNTPDDEMKRTVLLVLQKCSQVENITPNYLRQEVAPSFFQNFWTRRVALDYQMNKMVTHTTVILSEKMGCSYVIEQLINPLKDEAEPFRVMSLHAINRTVKLLGTAELGERLETMLVDALLIAFQEQTTDDPIIFRGFGTVAKSLNRRMKPFLSPIVSSILNQLKHKTQLVRQNAADLCNVLIPVIKDCGELEMINKLNIILYESLGEVYPEVLGSIIRVMGTIISVMDLSLLQPPVNQILPTLTPILRNKHKKVQKSTIDIVGFIALRGPSYVAPKEWMRICFELLEMLKSPNKSILRAANKTFGYIAKAVGPQDVLVLLLNNLKVQERQLRVCTAVAIGIVAESCGPYTVLPALMNEYKTPETNVQNGILKAMTFMFEYIGILSQDYIYLLLPILEDALTDRDLVHRQTAATIIKHLALHCRGSGNEDAFVHIINLLMPNIFETSPHVIVRILEGLEALAFVLGPGEFTNYVWSGLFHPSKNVRKAFWKVYNNVYIQQGDALVPYYPITNEASLNVMEMDLVL